MRYKKISVSESADEVFRGLPRMPGGIGGLIALDRQGNVTMHFDTVGMPRGYISADKNFDETLGLGWIPIDSAHSPVRRVNYRVESARLGRTPPSQRCTTRRRRSAPALP